MYKTCGVRYPLYRQLSSGRSAAGATASTRMPAANNAKPTRVCRSPEKPGQTGLQHAATKVQTYSQVQIAKLAAFAQARSACTLPSTCARRRTPMQMQMQIQSASASEAHAEHPVHAQALTAHAANTRSHTQTLSTRHHPLSTASVQSRSLAQAASQRGNHAGP